jgi:hypothetical protein
MGLFGQTCTMALADDGQVLTRKTAQGRAPHSIAGRQIPNRLDVPVARMGAWSPLRVEVTEGLTLRPLRPQNYRLFDGQGLQPWLRDRGT